MALWNLTSGKGADMRLWRTGPYKFRVVEYRGEPGDMLTNYDYILFDKRYEGALRTTGAQLQLTPVTVRDEYRKREWRNYQEATILHMASAEQIWDSSPVEPAIYLAGHSNVFVSTALKEILQQVVGNSFRFSWGLSLFG
jgi:hypothetical protein